MAERRMFAKTIIDSDAFLDMPLSTQSLYFHLSMRADDDGFTNNPKKIMRMIGSNDDDMKLLFAKNFIIGFESGVIVIKHWKLHNYIQKDRYKPTVYQEEISLLNEKENKVYTKDTKCIHNGDTGKVSIDKSKNSIGKASIELSEFDEALKDFEDMRKKIKKPLTDRAKEMVLKKLSTLSTIESVQIEILNQSTMNCWQGIFPLKDQNKSTIQTTFDMIDNLELN